MTHTSTKWTPFNVNNFVRIKLTEHGVSILKDRLAPVATIMKESVEANLDVLYPTWRTGQITMQMWDFCNTFGKYMHNGSRVPCETTIEIDGEKLG